MENQRACVGDDGAQARPHPPAKFLLETSNLVLSPTAATVISFGDVV